MKPSASLRKNKNNQKEINEIADTLIHNAINLRHWYEHFCELFNNTVLADYQDSALIKRGLQHSEEEETYSRVQFLELDQKHFIRFCKAFENVYPGIYDGLETSWCKAVEDSINTEQYFAHRIKTNCKHRIEETEIYKYPRKCYRCRNCQSFSHNRSFQEPKPENLPLELSTIISRNVNSHGLHTRSSAE
jgi:predicted transcriptional regulator